MTTTCDRVAALEQALCQRMGESRFKLWFVDKTKFTWHENQLMVGVPNLFLLDWLQKTFGDDIAATARQLGGASELPVRFAIDPQLFQANRQREIGVPAGAPPATVADTPLVGGRKGGVDRSAPLRQRRWRHLQDFVAGSSNRVAYASALSLVEAPEDCPVPLVLHGPVGTGKTHLLEGIRGGWSQRFPEWRILCVTAEEFTNRFVQAMHQHKLGAFRKTFRDCDALLVDDLHFLAKKQATQEEFLHTLDTLHTEQRPVVVTTDCHPRLADYFLPELTDRLVGGAVWGLTTPDCATRLELLRSKTLMHGRFPEDVLRFMAENLRGNVRELEGAVHRVAHLGKVAGRPIDVELAREALAEHLRQSVRFVQLEDVERVVCQVLSISREFLFSKKRSWMCSYPRMLAMYLARKHTNATYGEVGKHFGGRNHSTAVASEKKVRQWLSDKVTLQLGKRIMPVADIIERIETLLA